MKRLCLLILCCLATAYAWAGSPYVSRVFEFLPAPGQFVNTLPPYESGDNAASMAQKVQDRIAGKANGSTVSLGGFGGYVVVGFDHAIANAPDACDFKVYGNAYTGNAEPGVIAVMKDENGNGLPDDTWYEIKGSAHDSSATVANYAITYYRPSAENDAATTAVEQYIAWSDNRGGEGWLPKNTYHQQPYYPQWTDDPSYTLSGTRLPDNGHNTSETGQNWLLDAFDYGYADNWANTSEKSNIDIEWAVDAEGNPARLDAIHFVKVYNGIHQHCGWIGESSTEFCGIEDLHPIDAVDETAADLLWVGNPAGDWLQLCLARRSQLLLYRPDGRLLRRFEAEAGTQRLDCSGLPAGMYLLKSNNFIYKIIKH